MIRWVKKGSVLALLVLCGVALSKGTEPVSLAYPLFKNKYMLLFYKFFTTFLLFYAIAYGSGFPTPT
ncbi:hypothetical protein [Thermocrinis sp.]|uniref:hypothetical protein n=1 Tax=Thermocrinis sp. TaxID=2024383 RepID=UPI002FDD4D4A